MIFVKSKFVDRAVRFPALEVPGSSTEVGWKPTSGTISAIQQRPTDECMLVFEAGQGQEFIAQRRHQTYSR
jgi:hypothetical protein